MTRLDNIVVQQQNTRIRDAFFALCIALLSVLSITSVSTAVHAASTSGIVSR